MNRVIAFANGLNDKGRIKFEQVNLSHYFPHHKLGQIMLYES